MHRASISRLRNNLSAYLRKVRQGDRVVVTDRHQPVAEIVPFGQAPVGDPRADALRAMEQAGLLRIGDAETKETDDPPVRIRGKPVAETVIEDRR